MLKNLWTHRWAQWEKRQVARVEQRRAQTNGQRHWPDHGLVSAGKAERLGLIARLVRDVIAVQAVEASEKEVDCVASLLLELPAADVAVLTSSARFVEWRRGWYAQDV